MDRRLAIVAIVAGVVLAAGVGALLWRVSTSSNGAYVSIMNYRFSPGSFTVRAGTMVVWTNMDHVDHTVTFGEHDAMPGVGAQMGSGMMGHMGAYSYTFTEPGTYEYHCDPHPFMVGTLVVTG
ncbi:MAG TPA: plastocyanin/azurin family copper-binding protein [Thermoplasmata archaeon]